MNATAMGPPKFLLDKTGVMNVGPIGTISLPYTPWKMNMEPSNHQLRKENDLANLHDYVPCKSSWGVARVAEQRQQDPWLTFHYTIVWIPGSL